MRNEIYPIDGFGPWKSGETIQVSPQNAPAFDLFAFSANRIYFLFSEKVRAIYLTEDLKDAVVKCQKDIDCIINNFGSSIA